MVRKKTLCSTETKIIKCLGGGFCFCWQDLDAACENEQTEHTPLGFQVWVRKSIDLCLICLTGHRMLYNGIVMHWFYTHLHVANLCKKCKPDGDYPIFCRETEKTYVSANIIFIYSPSWADFGNARLFPCKWKFILARIVKHILTSHCLPLC